MSILSKNSSHIVLLALLLSSTMASAQGSSTLSVDVHNSRMLAIQQKVDKLYEAKDFERAFFLYRNELAPLGDKYAQYMVGFMYLTGTGVAENVTAASAWYQLAAERGTAEFVAVRDQLTRNLTVEQVIESDFLYADLRVEFSDMAILLALVKRDLNELESRTGTRTHSDSMSLRVVDSRVGRNRPSIDHYANIERRAEERLRLIKKLGEFSDMETDPKKVKIRELERRVLARLELSD